jgi:hypothetical protein
MISYVVVPNLASRSCHFIRITVPLPERMLLVSFLPLFPRSPHSYSMLPTLKTVTTSQQTSPHIVWNVGVREAMSKRVCGIATAVFAVRLRKAVKNIDCVSYVLVLCLE